MSNESSPVLAAYAEDGRDFFNEDGVVSVREFSEEEFAARDIEAIKNPPPIVFQ